MTQHIRKTNAKTLGEIINGQYPDAKIVGGSAPMDMDVSNGYEVQIADNSKHGYGVSVDIYPYVKWSDGIYKPCHYWGSEYYVSLSTR